MPGRKPKPTHLKIVTGNPGKRPLNKQEPTFASDLPVAPSYLSDRAKEIFNVLRDRLANMGYATASHTEKLALLAGVLARVEECSAIIEKQGMTHDVTNSLGFSNEKIRPEVAILVVAERRAQSLLSDFGLDPINSTKVVVPSKQKKNAFSAL